MRNPFVFSSRAGLVAPMIAAACCSCIATAPPDVDSGDEPTPFALFQDPDSDFSTTDVRDVDGESMRFDTTSGTLVWLADGSAFAGWQVNGNDLTHNATFRVRFGSKSGERQAYFTEVEPATICDLRVDNGDLQIFATDTPVPQD